MNRTALCGQSHSCKIQTLCTFDKGLKPSEFAIFPVMRGFDGYGVAFCLVSDRTIWITNADNNSLIRVSAGQKTVFAKPFGENSRPIGITALDKNRLICLVSQGSPRPSYRALITDTSLLILAEVHLRGIDHLLPPIWITSPAGTNTLWISHRGIRTDRGTPYPAPLLEVETTTGTVIRRWEKTYGVCALSGKIYFVGTDAQQPSGERAHILTFPKILGDSWLLVGSDSKERFYWFSSRSLLGQGNLPDLPRASSLAELACTNLEGTLLWRIPLTGEDGVLSRRLKNPSISLGWGGEWLEVDPDGAVYVFAYSGMRQVKQTVGIFRITVYMSGVE